MADERETHEPGHGDEDYALHSELSHEAKRLVTHPGDEVARLGEEARVGEADTTPAILIGGLVIWLAVAVALIIGLIVLVTVLVV